MDQRFHVLFHGRAWWRGDLVIFHPDGPSGHLIQTLMNDSQTLPKLLHPAQVPIVAIAIHAHGHVELDLVVGVVRLALAHVPGHAAATQHHAGEGVVEGVGGGDDADALRPAFPDAVVRQEFFGFVDPVAELRRPLVDVVQEAEGQVLVYAPGADVGGVEAGAGDAFVEFLK